MVAALQPLSGLVASSGGAPGVQVILLGAVLVVVVVLLLLVALRSHNQKGRRSAAAGARPSDGATKAVRKVGSTPAADRSLSPSFSSSDRGPTNRAPAAVRAPAAPLAPAPAAADVVEPAPPPAVPVFDRFAARALGPAGGRSAKSTAPTALPLLSVPPPPAAEDQPG
jgi:hypothetical protein